jgi:ATP-binding cassette subfamily C protein CydC
MAAIALANSVTPMTVAILMLLPLSAFEATSALPAAAVQLTRSRIAARRLRELTEPDSDMRMRPPATPVGLEGGARLAVTGPSGSGKTTLLMAMAENPSEAVFFAEDAHLFATTVRDNLLVARGDATDEELRNALHRVGLRSWLDGLPGGLSTILVGGAAAVSAGQRRRLLLARALISTAPMVLLDEPTEHLDAADGNQLLTELLTPGALFPADRTVVVATHHLPGDVVFPVLNLAGSG